MDGAGVDESGSGNVLPVGEANATDTTGVDGLATPPQWLVQLAQQQLAEGEAAMDAKAGLGPGGAMKAGTLEALLAPPSDLSKLAQALNLKEAKGTATPATNGQSTASGFTAALTSTVTASLTSAGDQLADPVQDLKILSPSLNGGASQANEAPEVSLDSRLMVARMETPASAATSVKAEASLPTLAQDVKLPHFEDPAWLRNIGEKAR